MAGKGARTASEHRQHLRQRTEAGNAVMATIALIAVAVLFASLFLVFGYGPRVRGTPSTGAPAPSVPRESPTCPGATLCDETAAVAASLAELPQGFTATDTVARNMGLGTALTWAGEVVDPAVTDPAKPVWLVGLRSPELTLYDLGYGLAATNAPVDGVFFIWDASGGGLIRTGGLAPPGQGQLPFTPTLADIAVLPTEEIPTLTPTPFPTLTPSW